jgi:hypothetical protein
MVDLLNLPFQTRLQIYLSIGFLFSVTNILLGLTVYSDKDSGQGGLTYREVYSASWPFVLIIGTLLWPLIFGGLIDMITK